MQPTLALLPNIGWLEWSIILAIFILFFGAKKLPELAKGVGKSIKEFKKATSNVEDEIRSAMEEDKPRVPPPAPAPQTTSPKD